jgi:hypothetical protein
VNKDRIEFITTGYSSRAKFLNTDALLPSYGFRRCGTMKCTAEMFSEDEEELLRLLKKRGTRSERMGFEEDWIVEREDGYDF